MPDLDLLEPALDRALRHTNFFNGRVLTARDLQDEQAAAHAHDRYLGQAVGEGVVDGFHVTYDGETTESVVRVTAGLAINREGGVLSLRDDVSVRLVPALDESAREGGLFGICPSDTSSPGELPPTFSDVGAYLLVVGPATGYEERVPLVGLTDGGVAGGCGDRFLVEGVQFRLVRFTIDPDDESATAASLRQLGGRSTLDAAEASQLRNLFAHYCLGTETLQRFPQDPRNRALTYGALDALRTLGILTGCEVPLAFLHWTDRGLQFVDEWAVRRRTAAPTGSRRWPLHVSPRRLAEAEAAFLQFQDQLDVLDGTPRLRALSYFRFLPPAGYVPTEHDTFFDGLETIDQDLDEAFVRSIVHESFFLAPIELDPDGESESEDPVPLFRYRIAGAPYVLFTRRPRTRFVDIGVPPQGAELAPGSITVRVQMPGSESPVVPGRGKSEGNAGSEALGALIFQYLQAKKRRPPYSEKDLEAAVASLFTVTATAQRPNAPIAYPVRPTLTLRGGGSPFPSPSKGSQSGLDALSFRTDADLPAGKYLIALTSPFGEQSTLRPLEEGEHLTVRFKLPARQPDRQPALPDKRASADWIQPKWYAEAHFPDEFVTRYAEWPWEPAEKPDFQQQPGPIPPEVEYAFRQLGDELRRHHRDAPVDPGDIRVYVDKDYTPDAPPPDRPYAYLAFGEGGAAVPLILTPNHRTLGRAVALEQSEVLGADRAAERRLQKLGVERLDVLAAGWNGLIEEALAVSAEAAATLLTSARDEVEGLHEGLRLFGGIDRDLRAGLTEAGLHNAVDLANAKPERLVETLDEGALSLPRARLLVEEARAAVDPAFWSLGAGDTGFSSGDVAKLTEAGLVTLKDLQDATATPEGQGEIEALLGASAGAVNDAKSQATSTIASAVDAARHRRTKTAPVSGIAEVERSTALALSTLGVATQEDLANADADDIAAVLDGGADAARTLIDAARTRVSFP